MILTKVRSFKNRTITHKLDTDCITEGGGGVLAITVVYLSNLNHSNKSNI